MQTAQATAFPIHVHSEHTDGALYRRRDKICYTLAPELREIGSSRLMSTQTLSARLLACVIDVHIFHPSGLINQSGVFFPPLDFVVYWNRMQRYHFFFKKHGACLDFFSLTTDTRNTFQNNIANLYKAYDFLQSISWELDKFMARNKRLYFVLRLSTKH